MKRKKYWRFALPRAVAALLIGAIIYGLTMVFFVNRYYDSIYGGFSNVSNIYEKILTRYDEGVIDETYASIMCNFYPADYIRLAKIESDGSFTPIYETRYDVVPVEMSIHEWNYVTTDEDLLSEENNYNESIVEGFTIEYKKCDELWDMDYVNDPYFQNTYNTVWQDSTFSRVSDPYCVVFEAIAAKNYPTLEATSYDEGDNNLHLEEISDESMYLINLMTEGDEAYFTSLSVTGNDDVTVQYNVTILGNYQRPDEFFEKEGDIFLAQSMDDLSDMTNPKIQSFYDSDEWYGVNEEYGSNTVQGVFRTVEINGNKYLMEYVLTTVSFTEYFKPFIIIYAIVLFVLCIGIALLTAIKPYTQYKKAYENNIFKNNLIDTLAHNLKTPLMILGGYAENLKDVDDSEEKNKYAEDILAKTTEMNNDIEAILKTADKINPVLVKGSVKEVFEQAAEKAGAKINLTGDTEIPMDREYFKHAAFCLIDNAAKYKTEDSDIDVKIGKKEITVTNKTELDKFTPGTGIAIAGRIIEQHKLKLKTKLEGGVFEAKISKK